MIVGVVVSSSIFLVVIIVILSQSNTYLHGPNHDSEEGHKQAVTAVIAPA